MADEPHLAVHARRRPRALHRAGEGRSLTADEIAALLTCRGDDLVRLLQVAADVRSRAPWWPTAQERAAGVLPPVTYSRKVFVPLTHLCRDACGYCTFAWPPRGDMPAFLSPDEVVAIAQAGQRAGCREVLFTLGDQPEQRYPAARAWLDARGYDTTLDYLRAVAIEVIEATGLIPHLNPGVMTWSQMASLKHVAGSMGLMLESVSPRLTERGQAHFNAPDKDPQRRLRVIEDAGRLSIPFTSGMLIGIGETLTERAETLLALRASHRRYGHLQEVIIQPFRAKPDTAMRAWPEPSLDDLLATIAVARIVLGPTVHVQAPPNLAPDAYPAMLAAGIDDWGGVSPVTPDHVNPEAPWPHIDDLAEQTRRGGFSLVERLCVYPEYVRAPDPWLAGKMQPIVAALATADGYADRDVLPRPQPWQDVDADSAVGAQAPSARMLAVLDDATSAGGPVAGSAADGSAARSANADDGIDRAVYGNLEAIVANTAVVARSDAVVARSDAVSASSAGSASSAVSASPVGSGSSIISTATALPRDLAGILARASRGVILDDNELLRLFAADGADLDAVAQVADELRAEAVGDTVTYVINRNINFTNVCYTGCRFCAFAQRRDDPDAYQLSLTQIADRASEAVRMGATEVCLQGGIHPDLGGDYYFDVIDVIRQREPSLHLHAFSPMEVVNGASKLGISVREWLAEAQRRGLGSVPGTAAEILDDDVRWVLTKGKLPAAAWIEVITTAHDLGLPSSSTMMYGHVDHPGHWVAHLKTLRGIQERTGGFTEFVPLPFVHQLAPIYLAGVARPGPTWAEDRRVHAVARIALNGAIDHLQVSWVKMGLDRAADILRHGADDLGGTLMEETISRMAGSQHGVRQDPAELVATAAAAGRPAAQRTTLYEPVTAST